ncbi:MAG: hypothetical protein ABR498_04245, partial [Candidatus Dormibacteria bacterium]
MIRKGLVAAFLVPLAFSAVSVALPSRAAAATAPRSDAPVWFAGAPSPVCAQHPDWLPSVTAAGHRYTCADVAATPAVNTSPTPQACVSPAAGNWCPSWVSASYDGSGHSTDAPGASYSTQISGTTSDGRVTLLSGSVDRSQTSADYQEMTFAYDTATGNTLWTAPFVAPQGDTSLAQALSVAGARAFVSVV